LIYYGYHLIAEGLNLSKKIKKGMNNYRLSNNSNFNNVQINLDAINSVLALPPIYEGFGFIRVRTSTLITPINSIQVFKIGESEHNFSLIQA
jgi:hypothetical protein